MQSGENDPTIRVLKHSVSVANVACDPFSSSMYRVSVEFKRRPRSRNILDFKPQEIRSLVIKLMTQNNGQGTLAIEVINENYLRAKEPIGILNWGFQQIVRRWNKLE